MSANTTRKMIELVHVKRHFRRADGQEGKGGQRHILYHPRG